MVGYSKARRDFHLGFRYYLVTFRALGLVAASDLLTYSKRIYLTSQRLLDLTQTWLVGGHSEAKDSPKCCGSGPATF